MTLLLALVVLAQPADAGAGNRMVLPRAADHRPTVELRGGFDARPAPASEGPASPFICGEFTPLRRVGLEGCGNGAGVLQNRDLSDFAHFRVRVTALQRTLGQWNVDVIPGVGWAEVQRGQDAAGFRFGEAEPGQVEAAGAEASMSVKGMVEVAGKLHGTIDLNAGAAIIPGAPEVLREGAQPGAGPLLPYLAVTAGLGF